jgi:hypothetical protein
MDPAAVCLQHAQQGDVFCQHISPSLPRSVQPTDHCACGYKQRIVICSQEGLANVCLVGSSTTVLRAKVESSLPRKRGAAAAGYDKALDSFFAKVQAYAGLIRTCLALAHACLCNAECLP